MLFRFFQKPSSKPRDVVCPLCQHTQLESSLAVSSTCRNCGAYLSFREHGEIVARPQAIPTVYTPPPPKPIPQKDFSPTITPTPKLAEKKKSPTRLAVCFECGDSHQANALGNSTQCRKCGRIISLEDQHIRDHSSRKIQTRGDVYIHRKGLVKSASIQCHHLIVEGDFTGSAECTGDLTIRRHGKIIGKLTCDRLIVEKRAEVDFLNTVTMNEGRIDGIVTGNLQCRGSLTLETKATLTGNIKVGSLTIAHGAKHTGQIEMGSS